jgi:hypothetical protein
MLEQAISPASWHSDPTARHRPVRQLEDLHARDARSGTLRVVPHLPSKSALGSFNASFSGSCY